MEGRVLLGLYAEEGGVAVGGGEEVDGRGDGRRGRDAGKDVDGRGGVRREKHRHFAPRSGRGVRRLHDVGAAGRGGEREGMARRGPVVRASMMRSSRTFPGITNSV